MKTKRRDEIHSVRFSKKDAEAAKKAAAKLGVSLSAFVAQAAAKVAAEALKKCPHCGRAHRPTSRSDLAA